MTSMKLRERLLDEIQRTPDTRIAEIFDLIHFFRIGLAAVPTVAETADAIIANLPAVGQICRNGISRHLSLNCNHADMRHSDS